jgi:hypothetical protein
VRDATARVAAVGGTREVPRPDPIARDYILLALRLEQQVPGTVDAYFGPADLKAQVDMEQPRAPAALREDALTLRDRARAVAEPDRRHWLDVQLVALEAQAAELAGEHLPYLELVERYCSMAPPRHDDSEFRAATAAIDAVLPGPGTTAQRLAELDARLVVPPDRILPVTQWLIDRFRAVADVRFGLPEGEDLRLGLVTQQPWGAYNWFHGGGRSRIDINTDLPLRAMGVPRVAAHEAYPGHHLEHAWKEADLVDRQARLENSILVMNAPECVISEGLANVGFRFVAPSIGRLDLYAELFDRAGLADPADPGAIRRYAELTEALWTPRRTLGTIDGNAAILRNADGLSHDAVVDYLCDVGAYAPERAQKRMEFLEHPVWRTYVFVYAEGEALLERWLAAVPPDEQPARFARLLHEQLTPEAVTIPGRVV